MRNQQIHICTCKTVARKHFFTHVHHVAYSVLVSFAALHGDKEIFGHRFAQAVTAACAAPNNYEVALHTVAVANHIFNAGHAFGGRVAHDAGGGRIAKQHAG